MGRRVKRVLGIGGREFSFFFLRRGFLGITYF
jgi:hypothetical protein